MSDQLHEFWIAVDDDRVTYNISSRVSTGVLKFNGQTSCSRATYPGHSISRAPRGGRQEHHQPTLVRDVTNSGLALIPPTTLTQPSPHNRTIQRPKRP